MRIYVYLKENAVNCVA